MFCFGSAVAAAVLSVIAANTDDNDRRGCGCRRNGVLGDYDRGRGNGCGCRRVNGCGNTSDVDDAFDRGCGCGCGRG